MTPVSLIVAFIIFCLLCFIVSVVSMPQRLKELSWVVLAFGAILYLLSRSGML